MINKDDQFWHDLNEREEEWSYEKMELIRKHIIMMDLTKVLLKDYLK